VRVLTASRPMRVPVWRRFMVGGLGGAAIAMSVLLAGGVVWWLGDQISDLSALRELAAWGIAAAALAGGAYWSWRRIP
jgi:hypothetical protein